MHTTRQLLLTVGPESADLPGFSQRAIQAALDHVAALGGGTVRLLAGTYTLRNAVRLRSSVRLEGVGDDTHLVKAAEVTSPLDDDSDWYDDWVSVADPAGFQVGDGIVLQGQDPHGGPAGLHRTKRTVVAIDGHRLYLDEGLNKNYWALTHEATASTLFPLLWGEATTDLEVADLRLDGNRAQNSLLDGNHAGCIFLQYVERAHLTGVTAHDCHGDGISWQVANDVHVLGCHVHDNVNLGLHPGSGSQRPVILENHCHHNGQGLFFCWGVKHGIAEGNLLEDNRDYGISIGHRDTDNRIAGNTIRRNAQVGVYYRAEEPAARLPHRNQLLDNTLEDNGAAGEGIGLWLRDRIEGTVVRGNRFRDSGGGAQRIGVRIEPEVADVTVDKNRFEGLETDVDDRRA
ncbi:MAG: right-handed parallel beta-helix repeat-containing protein [Armatimonadetes bacterium]|nr:right-handed parallel beta-helix repeat-containing protein [Armatimonadota bacterium]